MQRDVHVNCRKLIASLGQQLARAVEEKKVVEMALEEAENKLRAHDGLVELKNGIPATTGDAIFDEVLRVYPVAEMMQRQWLGQVGFDDLPFLRKALCKFFDVDSLSDLLSEQFFANKYGYKVNLANASRKGESDAQG